MWRPPPSVASLMVVARRWRIGWVTVHDKHGVFADVRTGLFKLSTLILGGTSIVQAALPDILDPAPGSEDEAALKTFHDETVGQLQRNAFFTLERMSRVPGIHVVKPQGAMYVMIGIHPEEFKDIANDVEFTQKLLTEENVFLLPGAAFKMPNFARIVFSVSPLVAAGLRPHSDQPIGSNPFGRLICGQQDCCKSVPFVGSPTAWFSFWQTSDCRSLPWTS
jgi:aspartate/methionine/tyrosine aminotransferase